VGQGRCWHNENRSLPEVALPPSPFAEFQPLAAIATTPAAVKQPQPL